MGIDRIADLDAFTDFAAPMLYIPAAAGLVPPTDGVCQPDLDTTVGYADYSHMIIASRVSKAHALRPYSVLKIKWTSIMTL